MEDVHCVNSVPIRSYSGPYFPALGLNTEMYFVSLRIQFECGKIRSRITPNTDTFYVVCDTGMLRFLNCMFLYFHAEFQFSGIFSSYVLASNVLAFPCSSFFQANFRKMGKRFTGFFANSCRNGIQKNNVE